MKKVEPYYELCSFHLKVGRWLQRKPRHKRKAE
jgi:hypothetical protein